MHCDEVYHSIDDLAEGHLKWIDTQTLEHFETCEVCRIRVIKWRKAKKILEMPVPAAPPDLGDSILEKIHKEETEDKKIIPAYWAMSGGLALAAMLLFSLGVWLYKSPFPFLQKSDAPVLTRETLPPDPSAVVLSNLEVTVFLPEAENVQLVGDFNGWDKVRNALQKDAGGNWSISLAVEPGYYQYQLLVDGREWILDPNNPLAMDDGFGGFNSGVYL